MPETIRDRAITTIRMLTRIESHNGYGRSGPLEESASKGPRTQKRLPKGGGRFALTLDISRARELKRRPRRRKQRRLMIFIDRLMLCKGLGMLAELEATSARSRKSRGLPPRGLARPARQTDSNRYWCSFHLQQAREQPKQIDAEPFVERFGTACW